MMNPEKRRDPPGLPSRPETEGARSAPSSSGRHQEDLTRDLKVTYYLRGGR
jgi:hypothetical protein